MYKIKFKLVFNVLIIFSILIFISFCKKDSTGLNDFNSHILIGNIMDGETNLPVSDVNIHFSFTLEENLTSVYNLQKDTKKVDNNLSSQEVELFQNFPNPFNPSTKISYQLPVNSHVLLEIYKWPSYELVCTLVNDTVSAGNNVVTWDGTDDYSRFVTNGIYAYRLTTNGNVYEKKMFLNMKDPEYIKSKNCIPLKTSNEEGEFQVRYSELPPPGFSLPFADGYGNIIGNVVVTDTFTVFLLKDGYLNGMKNFILNSTKDTNLDLEIYPSSN